MILHTVNKSPFERSSLESCLRVARDGSGILLIEDGVIGALAGTEASDALAAATDGKTVYVLGPDLQARGLSDSELVTGVKVIDYGGFVDLAEEFHTVQAWT